MSLAPALLEVSGLLALAVLLAMLARRVHLPLTVVLVVVALAASAAGLTPSVGQLGGEAFHEVVILGFLPVLVFSAALGSDVRSTVHNLTPILALAVPAFLASAVLVGAALHLVLGVELVVALLFGALISATDPVAVVAVFREVGVPRRLLSIVEGESLFNDGVAIVVFTVLLEAATGGHVSPAGGLADFVLVALGGACVGVAAALAVAFVLPWLDRLPATALTLALAYGVFALAEHVLHVSGVVATVAAGLVLAGVAPSRASAAVRETWDSVWESLDYVANALLFLLIGLVLDAQQLLAEAAAIGLTVVVVLLARPLAVVPVVWLLERVASVPRVGWRNEAVLVWGGLRGGVALALALALPDEVPSRDLLVALTGGVVLATLLVNATTIRWLVSWLELDEPTRAEQFLAATSTLAGIRAARRRLDELGLEADEEVARRLDEAERQATEELGRLELDRQEELLVVTGRGLHVERDTYQRLSDAGLLPNAVTRTLLHEVDDEVDELAMCGGDHDLGTGRSRRSRLGRGLRWVLARLPRPLGADPQQLAYAEATARWTAARRTSQALDLFDDVPAVRDECVERARRTFSGWEQDAQDRLAELDERDGASAADLHRRQASMLARAASVEEVEALTRAGLVPDRVEGGVRERLDRALRGEDGSRGEHREAAGSGSG